MAPRLRGSPELCAPPPALSLAGVAHIVHAGYGRGTNRDAAF